MSDGILAQPLRGIIPPMVTPLLDRDTLDVAGLERLIEHILAGGVHGLFILGTTGETPSLSHRLRHELIERVCAQVRGRVPVLVGITDTSFVESVELGRKAAQVGAQALVLAPPYYFPAGSAGAARISRASVAGIAAAAVPVQHAEPSEAGVRAADGEGRRRYAGHCRASRTAPPT